MFNCSLCGWAELWRGWGDGMARHSVTCDGQAATVLYERMI